MGTLGNRTGGILLSLFLTCAPLSLAQTAQNATLGIVQQANRAHLGQAALTEGTTVYAGEQLSTEAGGMLEIQVAGVHYGLPESSQVSFYPRGKGSIGEVTSGTLTFKRDAGGTDLEAVASDVRIVADGDGPVMGQVTIVSACKITVTSFLGQLNVSAGTETHTVKEKESYSVIPEVSVFDVRAHVSPDDSGYHESHSHKACAVRNRSHGAGPLSAGQTRFALIAGGAAAGLLAILVSGGGRSHSAQESPSIP